MVRMITEAAALARVLLSATAEPGRAGSGEGGGEGGVQADAGLRLEMSAAIARRDTPALYRLLMDGFSFQGINDAAARSFIALHGNADWRDVDRAMRSEEAACPKLTAFTTYVGCGYQKTGPNCTNPAALKGCLVPKLPLRKGRLNEQAISLYLLIRDRCGGDLVGFIDCTIAIALEQSDPVTIAREAILAAFTSIVGVSRKLASMMCAELLLSAGDSRPAWREVGKSMVAVDSLVHAWLHRTGILTAYRSSHPYGTRCFGLRGCEWIIRDLAERLAGGGHGQPSPRELQHAIWRFCAADELAICNGWRIPARSSCEQSECPLWQGCARLPLTQAPEAAS